MKLKNEHFASEIPGPAKIFMNRIFELDENAFIYRLSSFVTIALLQQIKLVYSAMPAVCEICQVAKIGG